MKRAIRSSGWNNIGNPFNCFLALIELNSPNSGGWLSNEAPAANCLQSRSEYGLMYRGNAGPAGMEHMVNFALVQTRWHGLRSGLGSAWA